MSHIFISYSRKDLTFAQKIVDALAANNLDTWIDWKSIPKGEDWEQEIYHGIEGADAFLFLVSPDSVISEMCNKEVAHAVANGKRILPIFIATAVGRQVYDVVDKFLQAKPKEEIRRRNFIYCRPAIDDFDSAITETRKTIQTDYDWLRYHTRLQVKALEWEREMDASLLLRGRELKDKEQKLAGVTSEKDPQPTDLQRTFLRVSREHARTMRRRIVMILIIAILTISSLSVLLYFLWGYSSNESLRANQEATQRAVAEWAGNEARVNQVAAQAENILLGNGDVIKAAQLILKSDQVTSSYETRRATYLLSTLPMPDEILEDKGSEISDADYNEQKDLILTVGIDSGHAIVWNAANGEALYSLPITRISSAYFSYNGSKIITTDWGNRIRVWDTDNGLQLYSIDDYGGELDSSNFSQVEPYVIYPCDTHFICVLNYEDGRQQNKINAPVERVSIASFGYDNNLVIAYGDNQNINVFDIGSGTLIKSITSENCGKLALSSKGYLLACENYDGEITVWDYMTGEQVVIFKNSNLRNAGEGLVRGNLSISFSPSGNIIGMVTPHGQAALLDINQNSQIKLESEDVISLDFDLDGQAIVTGHLDGTARTWDVRSGKELIKFQSHQDVVLSAHFISGSNNVITTSVDGTARIWNLTPLNLFQHISADVFISMSKFSHDVKTIALVASDNTIRIWDTKNDTNLFVLDGHEDDIVSIDFSFDDNYLVSASRDDTFRIWDLSSGEAIKVVSWHKNDVLSAKFSPDGKRIASVDLDGNLCLWDAKNGNLIHEFIGHEGGIFDVFFNGDGSELLTIDYSGVIGQWDVLKEKLIRFYEMKANGLDSAFNLGYTSMIFSKDGSLIAAVGKDEVARVWDADSGKQIAMFWKHPGLTSILFSPDGSRILTYGNDNAIRIWDISTGDMKIELTGHSGESDTTISDGLVSVQFNQSGNEIISIGRDDTLRIWDLEQGQNLAVLPIARTYSATVSDDGLKVGAYDSLGNFDILNIDSAELIKALKSRLEFLGIGILSTE